jgi:hypothetical protein
LQASLGVRKDAHVISKQHIEQEGELVFVPQLPGVKQSVLATKFDVDRAIQS